MLTFQRFLPVAALAATMIAATPSHAAPGEKFPQTKTHVLSNAELTKMTAAQRRYAINEIYARHGFNFGDVNLRKQFLHFKWYKPVPGMTQAQAQKRFTKTEKRNVDRLALVRAVSNSNEYDDQNPEDVADTDNRDYVSPYTRNSQGLTGEHFPETRLDKLNASEIGQMTDAQLRYALNEIYARHGYNFGDMALRKQFLSFGWYKPRPGVSMTQIAKNFSARERANAQLLTSERHERN